MSSSGDERYFVNDFPQDIGDDKNKIMDPQKKTLSKEYLEAARKNLVVLQKILDVGVAKGEGRDDISVYTGISGYSLLYLHLADCKQDSSYFEKASSLLRKALRHLKGRRLSFLCGDPGPLALAAIVHHKEGDTAKMKDCISQIEQMKEEVINPTSGLADEMLYGRAGYLYALLLLQKKSEVVPVEPVERETGTSEDVSGAIIGTRTWVSEAGSDVAAYTSSVIISWSTTLSEIGKTALDASLVRSVVTAILDSGRCMAKRKKSNLPLQYEWHDKDYHGAAHGTAGILFMLMEAKEHLTSEELEEIVRPMVDYLSSIVFQSGNLPSSSGSERDRLVQWCHGAPGAVYLFGKAYQIFGNENYLEEAKRAGECVWLRGILKKGYGLCHGTAGNGYALLYLYQITHDPKYLYQAGRFGLWCQDYGVHGCRTADRPLSLFEGLAGVLHFLVDLQDPDNAHFPAFVLH